MKRVSSPLSDMNEQKYNNQDITKYLLGSLPEIEAERFDELSFTDDDFADALKSVEKDLVDAYVQGELAGATLEKFKSHYLASPLRREKVEFAKVFQDFAKRNISKKSENSAAEESKPKRTIAGFFSSLNIFTNQNPLLQWGFAAAALAFVVLGGLWIVINRLGQENQLATQATPAQTNQELPKPIEERRSEKSIAEREVAAAVNEEPEPVQPNPEKESTKKPPIAEPKRTPKQVLPSIIASFILAPSLRGNNRIQTVSVSRETSGVVMQLQLESDDYKSYQVVLVNQSDNKNIWRSGTLKIKSKGENKLLNVPFPAKLLKSKTYSLQVSGISADGTIEIISDYPFRVVR